jgi:hypothetical protein
VEPLYPAAVACVADHLDALVVHLLFPAEHHKRIRHSKGWRGLTMTPKALRRLQDLRRELLGQPRPPAATPSAATRPGDPDSWETLPDDERAWIAEARRPARRRTTLLLGLAVVAVIVSRLVYRRFQR